MKNPVKYIPAAALILFLVGGICVAGFYHEEVFGYLRLQGWNTGPVTDASKQFIRAASQNDSRQVEALLATDVHPQPVKKGDQIEGFRVIGAFGAAKVVPLKELCPSDSPKLETKLLYMRGGCVQVDGRFADGRVLSLRWDRRPEGWRVIEISQERS